MSFEFEVSGRDAAAARFIRRVHSVLMRNLVQNAKNRKLTKADVARLLDCDRSMVTRMLDGKSNLTLRSVSDLSWAIGVEPDLDLIGIDGDHSCNVISHHNQIEGQIKVEARKKDVQFVNFDKSCSGRFTTVAKANEAGRSSGVKELHYGT